jgi:hypothetical protein
MEISKAALDEFIELYKAEFNEDINRDEALIIARNLIIFYEEMYQERISQAAGKKEEPPFSDTSAKD